MNLKLTAEQSRKLNVPLGLWAYPMHGNSFRGFNLIVF
jgi:hypothetical protein